MLIYLTKFTEQGHERYYKIIYSKNLFDEFFVIREFGNTNNKKPTRVIENSFLTEKDAELFFIHIKRKKTHRGYHLKCA